MADESPNLTLPYIAPAQAQKHVTHNEALAKLDAVVQLSVLVISDTALTAPETGQRLIVGQSPAGAFETHSGEIAVFEGTGWSFIAPRIGWRCYVEDIEQLYIFTPSGWQHASPTAEAMPRLGINAAADSYNRLSINAPASLFNNEGASHQLKINKALETDTASVLFQSGFTAHAEMGLTGGQDFHIKTSTDGGVFKDSLIAHASSGALEFPNGTEPDRVLPSISESGGDGFNYGIPNNTTVYYGRGSLTLIQNRMYFSAFYVDRPTVITGGLVAQFQADAAAGNVIRTGIYHIGTPNGNSWDIGERVADCGVHPSDTNGALVFDLSLPVTLQKGWYASAIGTNGSGVQVRFARAMQGGQYQLTTNGSGSTTDLRFCGPSNYMLSNNSGLEITSGLPQTWPSNPVIDSRTTNSFSHLMFIPRWQAW